MPRDNAISRNQMQLAKALSSSLEESKKREVAKVTEDLPVSHIEAGNVPQNVTDLQQEFLSKFKNQKPGVRMKAKRIVKNSKPVPDLLSRSKDERTRIVIEKVALVLIKDDNSDAERMKETRIQSSEQKGYNTLWSISSTPSGSVKEYYTEKLHFHMPSDSFNAEKLVVNNKLLQEDLKSESVFCTSFVDGAISSQCQLQSDWQKIVNCSEFSDVTVIVKDRSHLYAHKVVFYVRCPLILEDVDHDNLLQWVTVTRSSALKFLSYLYSGNHEECSLTSDDTSGLVYLANRYKISELLKHVIFDKNIIKTNSEDRSTLAKEQKEGSNHFGDGVCTNSVQQQKQHLICMTQGICAQDQGSCIAVDSDDDELIKDFFGTCNPTVQKKVVPNTSALEEINIVEKLSDESASFMSSLSLTCENLSQNCGEHVVSMKSGRSEPTVQKNIHALCSPTNCVKMQVKYQSERKESVEMSCGEEVVCTARDKATVKERSKKKRWSTSSSPIANLVVDSFHSQLLPSTSEQSSPQSSLTKHSATTQRKRHEEMIESEDYCGVDTITRPAVSKGKKRAFVSPVIWITSSSDEDNDPQKEKPTTLCAFSGKTSKRCRKTLFVASNTTSHEKDMGKSEEHTAVSENILGVKDQSSPDKFNKSSCPKLPDHGKDHCIENISSSAGLHSSTQVGNMSCEQVEHSVNNSKKQNKRNLLDDSLTFDICDSVFLKESQMRSVQTPQEYKYSNTTSPVTPIPDYVNMSDQQLKEELDKYGLKKTISRSKGIKLLKYIYGKLHPLVEVVVQDNKEVLIPVDSQTTSASHNINQPADSDTESPENSSGSSESVVLEETIFVEEVQTPSDHDPLDLRNVVCSWIMQQPEIYEMILSYEPLWLDSLHEELKKLVTRRISINHLMEVLDEEGITFRTVQGQQSKKKQTRKNSIKNPCPKKKNY